MSNKFTKLRSMIGPADKLEAAPEEWTIRHYILALLEIAESQDARIKSLESAVKTVGENE